MLDSALLSEDKVVGGSFGRCMQRYCAESEQAQSEKMQDIGGGLLGGSARSENTLLMALIDDLVEALTVLPGG